jgi:RimJ/RimL family protein N-acetyltransferase
VKADIHTDRFHLRDLTLDDVSERYLQWFRDPDAGKYISASGATQELADLRDYVLARTGRPDILFLGIFDKATGVHIGNVKYEPVNADLGYAKMGILIGDPSYRGRGVAPEVLAGSAQWLKQHRGVTHIVLTVLADNRRAIRAYEAAGFAVEDTPNLVPESDDLLTMVLWL